MNTRSITFRLIFLYSGSLLVLGAGLSFFTIASFHRYTHQTMQTVISARASDIWNIIQGSLDDPAELATLIDRRFSPSIQSRFIRVSLNGKVIYQSNFPATQDSGTQTAPPIYDGPVPESFRSGNLLIYARRFTPSNDRNVLIESGQSDEFAQGLEARLATSLIIGLSVLFVIVAIEGYVLIRRALAPVEMMIKAAEAITFNNPRNRLPLLGTADRIEALGLALNRMLDRLDNAYQHASRFSTDAAHELRTPLTIIRAGLEFTIFNRALAPDAKEALHDLLEEVTRLGNMVDHLLILSRMESLWGKRAHSDVDLLALASEAVDQMQFIADEKNIKLGKPTGEPVVVAGDRDRLKQVLVNLLDNGIKYNTVGGAVSVDVRTVADQAVITITDTGIGIAPDSQEYIFDRFYRVSTNRGENGVGLGLAIVRSICHAHGGIVDVRSTVGAGSTFSIKLPLNASAVTSLIRQPGGSKDQVKAKLT